jgi:hypothetical protein
MSAPVPVKPVRIYSRSPVLYWWPIWSLALLLALLTYLGRGRVVWVPRGTEARPDLQVEVQPGQVQTRSALLLPAEAGPDQLPTPDQPLVRMARGKAAGFAFVVVLALVLLHSTVLLRGFVSYVSMAVGVIVVLAIPLIEAYAPWEVHAWSWLRYLLYDWWNIYISLHGYLFLAALFLLIQVGVYWGYDRRTYIEVAPSQVRIVQEIGEGESVYDTTSISFEKKRDDFFRHKILGLGLLHVLGLGFLTTGAGDLVFRTSGSNPQVIEWPNVMDIHRHMETLTRLLPTRQVV